MRMQERLRRARPLVESFNKDIKQSMMRPRYKPSYERRKQIEKMNEQLVGSMMKIEARKNRYFNELEGPPINHHTAMRLATQKRIMKSNLQIYEDLNHVRPRIVS
jgi:hypothetical protein